MALLDQIDPNLRHVVEELRRDRTSLFFRGGPRSKRLENERLRPVSSRASSRIAESYLLETYAEELSAWLLRGVFAEWQRLNPLGPAYRCEERRPARLAWTRAEVLRSSAEIEAWPLTAAPEPVGTDARQGLFLLETLGRGQSDVQALLEACALAHSLAPLPEAGLFAAQALVAQREWAQAMEVAGGVEAPTTRPDLAWNKFTWMGMAAWHRGNLGLADSRFSEALRAGGSPQLLSVHWNVLIAGSTLADPKAAWRRFELSADLSAEGALEDTQFMIQSLQRGHRENPAGLSGLALSRLLRVGPDWFRELHSKL